MLDPLLSISCEQLQPHSQNKLPSTCCKVSTALILFAQDLTKEETMSLLRATDVAETLGVSEARVYDLVRRRLIPAVKIGARQIRFDKIALTNWIASGGSRQTDAPEEAAARVYHVDETKDRANQK